MSLTADQIVDRRRLRRKLTLWRVIAFLAIAAAIVGIVGVAASGGSLPGLVSPQIARVTISGFINEDRDQLDLLDRLGNADGVKGVIVAIDSSGGATAGGEALYESLRRLSARKPTVAAIGTTGASAAYMAAIATDHVVARRSSLTGSIGVIMLFPDVSKLMQTVGVAVSEVKSSPLKAEPSPFGPPSEEAKAVMSGVVLDSYNWFVDIVADRRKIDRADALRLADGRIFTGHQALDAKLIDEVGGEEQAIAWLATKGVDAKLPVKDWEPDRGGRFSFTASDAFLWVARQLGIGSEWLRGGAIDRFLPDRLKLDGLVSVWQGQSGTPGTAEGARR